MDSMLKFMLFWMVSTMIVVIVVQARETIKRRRKFLDPAVCEQSIRDWYVNKNLEDFPAQIDWEHFEAALVINLNGDPFGQINTDHILFELQKKADKDYRALQAELDEKEEHTDPRGGKYTPPCRACGKQTKESYPLGIDQILNTEEGPQVADYVSVQCTDKECGWWGQAGEARNPAQRQWKAKWCDTFGKDGHVMSRDISTNGQITYSCRCGYRMKRTSGGVMEPDPDAMPGSDHPRERETRPKRCPECNTLNRKSEKACRGCHKTFKRMGREKIQKMVKNAGLSDHTIAPAIDINSGYRFPNDYLGRFVSENEYPKLPATSEIRGDRGVEGHPDEQQEGNYGGGPEGRENAHEPENYYGYYQGE